MDTAMPRTSMTLRLCRRWLALAVVAAVLAVPAIATAQVVVVANGSPITELDIQQRMKLVATSTKTNPTRQEVINDLIDDRLKISRAKVYGLEVSDAEVDQAFEGMAKRQHVTPQQFGQMLEHNGISPNTIKSRIRAELTWGQLVRGKFGSSLQVGESDIANVLRDRTETDKAAVGYVYTLYPITVVFGREANDALMESKRREAENLRSRFVNCTEGLVLARELRDLSLIHISEPTRRTP